MWDDDDDYRRVEDLLDAGWIDEDNATELRELLKFVEWPEDATSKGTAALVLIEHILTSPTIVAGSDEAARLQWAKVKLNRHLLV